MKYKKCNICNEFKESNDNFFYNDKNMKDKLTRYCKNCSTLKRINSNHTGIKGNIKIRSINTDKNTRKCIKCFIEKDLSEFGLNGKLKNVKRYYSYCKSCDNIKKIINKYNITKEEYLEKIKIQNNCCKICGKSNNNKNLFVDHNHKTNKVRDLLCAKCNTGLGMFEENIEYMNNAISYLKYHNM